MMSSRGNRHLRLRVGGLLRLIARGRNGGGFVVLEVVVLRLVLVCRLSWLGLAGLLQGVPFRYLSDVLVVMRVFEDVVFVF